MSLERSACSDAFEWKAPTQHCLTNPITLVYQLASQTLLSVITEVNNDTTDLSHTRRAQLIWDPLTVPTKSKLDPFTEAVDSGAVVVKEDPSLIDVLMSL